MLWLKSFCTATYMLSCIEAMHMMSWLLRIYQLIKRKTEDRLVYDMKSNEAFVSLITINDKTINIYKVS